MKIKVEKGVTYFLCSCEKSARYPLCDGAHKGTGMKSICYTSFKEGEIVFEKGEIIEP